MYPAANAADPTSAAATVCFLAAIPVVVTRVRAKSTRTPSAKKTSCSRTIAMRAAANPSEIIPGRDHVRRTRSQTVTNSATANAEQACENGGAMYE
jgi:hypothetical protein